MPSKEQTRNNVAQNKPQIRELSPVRKPMMFKNRWDVFRAKNELLKAGSLYQDELFPPTESEDEAWVRPIDISAKPSLTISPMVLDVHSDIEGNDVLVGAFASVCWRNDVVARLCPDSQSFTNNYCGLFYFQFWQFGEWTVVVIDDRLPYSSSKRKLLRLRSKRDDEFFFSLLEKAYAKMIGGYGALARLKAGDVLASLTGGVSEMWLLTMKDTSDWFPCLERLAKVQLPVLTNLQKVNEAGTGFDWKITYLLRDAFTIDLTDENRTVRLVKLADPWGKLTRYNGDWNNEAPDWRKVPQHLREKMAPRNDGSAGAIYEFWMTFHDFMSVFTYVHFCAISTKDMGPVEQGFRWDLLTIKGQFPRYIPTVSNIEHKDSTVHEVFPQYIVELNEIDEHHRDGKCELVVNLIQKNPPRDERWMKMGFSLFPVIRRRDNPPMAQNFFNDTKEAARSPVSSSREIVSRFRLLPGRYVIVVLTTSEFKLREFMVRIYKHQRLSGIVHVIEHLTEMDPERKCMIPPSSRQAPVGAYDGPTTREELKKLQQ